MKKKIKNKVEIERIESSIETGLTTSEVELRKKAGLNNPTRSGSNISYFSIVMSELFTYFNILYMLITIVLIAVGSAGQLTYLAVIIPNLIIGIWQKCKSKYNIDKLSLMVKVNAQVKRDGKYEFVDLQDIVRDDIIKYSLGNQISADSILLTGECEVNESMLTGESLPVKKKAGDRLYAGSYITSGSCEARVYDVGDDNYINKLTSRAKRYNKPRSEILNTLNGIIKVMGIAIIPLAIFLFLRTENVVKVAGAMIGMIPSGMFLLTSTALAVSMIRLSKQNTLVQEMYCIEMLARVDTICMDKTGTITDGSMNVQKSESLHEKFDKKYVDDIVSCMLNSVKEYNPTSLALSMYFKRSDKRKEKEYLAFSSDRKYFGVKFEDASFVLGAPEYVLNIEKNEKVKNICNEEASVGNRVLVLAQIPKSAKLDSYDKDKATAIGMIVLEDHVREDAIETIKYFKQNEVALKVISGDNPLTVSEVAKRAGIEGAEKYISLQDMSIEEVEAIANDYVVFGRVSPQQKEALIRAIKNQKHTVAMIGDGVNDILALRESDCSVAVGGGTEAAKNVSHLILVDNNFANMKQVIAEGRRCTNNLQCTGSMFLTKTFICLVLCVFSIITAFDYPFNPNQLLLLEFFAIGLPGFFFALQPNSDIIRGKFLDNVLSKAFAQGLTALILCLPLYFFLLSPNWNLQMIQMMIIMIVTINSLVVLFRVNKINKFRLIVASSMFVLVILSFVFLTDLFNLNILTDTPFDILGMTAVNRQQLGIVLVECLLIYPLQMLIYKITKLVIDKYYKIVNNRKKKLENIEAK